MATQFEILSRIQRRRPFDPGVDRVGSDDIELLFRSDDEVSCVVGDYLDAQVLLMALDMSGVACSVGSACSSGSTELSPTLLAMGLPSEIVKGSLRFSLGATTTEAEIDEAVGRILNVVRELQQ